MNVFGLKFVEEFKQYLVDEDHDWGHHYIFRFTNNYGASVIKNACSYGNAKGLWEMALIFFDENGDWNLTYERDFDDDVKGYLTDDNVIELLEKIKQYRKEKITMSKRFDNFVELVDDMKKKFENGEIDSKAVDCTYMAICAGHLAYIVDKLDEITSKLEEKENKDEQK